MMAENNKNIALNLLFIDQSSNSAEEKVSVLRNAGIAVHPQVACTLPDLESTPGNFTPDLILFSSPGKRLDLLAAVATCKKRFAGAPMIVLAGDLAHDKLIQSMQQGVRDVLFTDNPQHLILAVKREFGDLTARRALHELEESLKESEQRCAVLMKSSRDAIVYVHDGMHVYANAVYLEMFGYEEMDEIEGLPILEMIASEDRTPFKKFLRTLGTETQDLEIHCQDSAGKTFKSMLEFSPEYRGRALHPNRLPHPNGKR